MWWSMTVISAMARLKQEDCEYEASVDYIVRLHHKTKQSKKPKPNKTKGKRRLEMC
jgi:hypothetical protein